ncbi:IPT/TIG domain-containing protein [Streptomyces lavenduligriseus]|uniref:IPT/TIG domain-containing protein n=1 Tax=Streptomyces lavenduligriseus TaxID=67315 RepID=A0ABT0P3N1_9ACTN|nr:IPT/TIG domain-containing protein [Streptomyces lavenduligriseus]MCL3998196.1 IPT/TIG domain-containing protein [Streptomyces lavenduligriseus]
MPPDVPHIDALKPNSGKAGAKIDIFGDYLFSPVKITFGAAENTHQFKAHGDGASVTEVVVPAGSGTVEVIVHCQENSSNGLYFKYS